MRWASFHNADQELLDLLRVESERLFVMIDPISTISASLPPEVLEPVRRRGHADRSAGDRPVPEPALNGAGVVPLVGER
jgi:hypothetical protein